MSDNYKYEKNEIAAAERRSDIYAAGCQNTRCCPVCQETRCCPGPAGPIGPMGPTGATGPIGETGPTGATGTSLTANSMNAVNATGDTITVVLGGTVIPLPDYQELDGFTTNATNAVFTVPFSGTYMISYRVSTTAALLMSSRVLRNGNELGGATFSPAVSVSTFTATTFAALDAGDRIQLQLFGLIGAAVLQLGNGANLTIIRLS